jgi:hypothetical protein
MTKSLFNRIFLKPVIRKVERDGVVTGGINLLQMIVILSSASAVLIALEYFGVIDDIVKMVIRK